VTEAVGIKSDGELLRAFSERDDEQAFREIVGRHAKMVYGAAARQAGETLAEDVTQRVFILLTRKAPRVDGMKLAAWLLSCTRLMAKDQRRREVRLKQREIKAAERFGESVETAHPNQRTESGRAIEDLRPLLDGALARLREKDRSAVALRYLEERSIAEVATVMGSSEAAIAKRVTRAVAKLREDFARHGVMLSAAAIEQAIQHCTSLGATPARLVHDTSAAALSAQAAAVKPVFATGLGKVFIGVATVMVLTTAAVLVSLQLRGHSIAPAAGAVSTSAKPAGKIKVGVLLSEYTATGPCWTDNRKQFGYLRAREALNLFTDPEVELYAILEPNTKRSGEIAPLLQRVGSGRIIDGTDLEALRRMDVIASYFQWNVRPEVLKAIDQVVHEGVGFYVKATAGSYHPGYTKEVQDLQAIRHAKRYYVMGLVSEVRVVAPDHPLTAAFKDLPDHTLMMPTLSGSIGEIQGTPLMESNAPNMVSDYGVKEATDTGTWDPPTTQPLATTFYPLYVAQLGKGRAVVLQWETAGTQFDALTQKRFHIHCFQWLAGRPLD
jgi:RNA polymerase sigma factor (sigma-70 family)